MIQGTRGAARAAAALLVAVALAGCDTDRRAISRDDLPAFADGAAATIVVSEDGFDTAAVDVSTDDHVEFRFRVAARLTIDFVVGEDRSTPDEVDVDSGVLEPGETLIVSFDEEGRHLVTLVDPDGSSNDSAPVLIVESSPAVTPGP